MEVLIPVINKLQDVFSLVGKDPLDLPQIVVVGSQSSGKSSVLENIVMRDFLPRGKDIVTRRPLLLQLIQTRSVEGSKATSQSPLGPASGLVPPSGRLLPVTQAETAGRDGEQQQDEWGEFLHLPGQKFRSFDAIRAEIEADTLKVAGPHKGITKQPIHLKIYSPHLLTLTLVDLPGITKIPVGDQPPDIEQQTKQLIYEYISRPNSIILAVTPANLDLVNSEALKLAREVDPLGLRTVGVLTKLDLMDAGTNALEILTNSSECRLRLGFIGVVNRSQQDILNGKPLRESLKHEEDFFRTHAVYRTIADRCGSPCLSRTLNALLMQHIRSQLPGLRSKLSQLVQDCQNELQGYGEEEPNGRVEKGGAMLRFLLRFSNSFCERIDGTSSGNSPFSSEMAGGARINFIFNDVFVSALSADPAATTSMSHLSLGEVKNAIRGSTGTKPSLFVPEKSFEMLVKKQIAKTEPPGMRCVELVQEELVKLIQRSDHCCELRRFPVLLRRITEVAVELVRERLQPTMQMVQDLILIETAYLNTNHPDFVRAGSAISALGRVFDERKKKQRRGATADERDGKPFAPKQREHGLLSYLFRSPAYTVPPTPLASPPPLGQTSKKTRQAEFEDEELLLASLTQLSVGTPSDETAEEEYHSEKEEMEVHLIYTLVQSYCGVVRRTLSDSIPKAIMHFMVNWVKEHLHNRLVTLLYREELLDSLLQEDPAVQTDRKSCKELLEIYKRAAGILAEVKECYYK